MARRHRKDDGLFDLIAEVSGMLFEHIPTGWSLPMAAGWLILGASVAGKCTISFLPLIFFVLLGAVPALITLLVAWQIARKKGAPFLSFGSNKDEEYEAYLDAALGKSSRPTSTPDTRPWTQVKPASTMSTGSRQPTQSTAFIWNLDLLRELEWRRFELLVEGLFRHKGLRVEGGAAGADGGIDLTLYEADGHPMAIIQCKAWREKQVGVSTVRELFGVMASEQINQGMVFTCGEFSADAEKFAENKSVDLVSGKRLLTLIDELPPESRATLLREITAGDYTTPTCPKCRVKLVRRQGARGEFWGCVNFPAGCRTTMYVS